MTDTKPTHLRLAVLSHVGALRQANEDCTAIGDVVLDTSMTCAESMTQALSHPRLCLIADGMGGHPAGEVASRLGIEALINSLPGTHASDEAVSSAIRNANCSIFEA